MIRSGKLTLLILVAVITATLLIIPQPAKAATCTDFSCSGCKDPKIDLACQRSRLITPCVGGQPKDGGGTCCTLLYCGDTTTNPPLTTTEVLNVNFFGVKISVDSDKEVATLIYLLFSIFFGFVAFAVTLLGVYGAYLRSRAESADDEAKAAKLLTNAIIGLILIVLSLVIAQIVASSLGIKSLDQLVDFSGVFG